MITLTHINYRIASVVQTFEIENVAGKKVYIYDHMKTRVGDDDTLKYLLNGNTESLILKMNLIGVSDAECTHDAPITSAVIFSFFLQ